MKTRRIEDGVLGKREYEATEKRENEDKEYGRMRKARKQRENVDLKSFSLITCKFVIREKCVNNKT